ncbi:MAG: ATP-dependent Clp protease proteolytic subunit, partial [Anaerolineae bacterium]
MNKLKLGALILLSFILLAGIVTTATGQTAGNVLVLNAEGPVSAVMVSYIERGIAAAEAQNAAALVIQLDTPGGQTDLTRDIMRAIINSNVPVVVYVYPPGGFAASAGTFITLAGHIAAMAPQTSIGAASPVDGQGGDIGETMRAKI